VELVELASDLNALWSAPTTTHEDRKALLRAMIAEIVVRRATDESVELEIVWAGGRREPLTVLRAKGVQAVAREQHAAGKTVDEITADLQAADVTTAFCTPLTRTLIMAKLRHGGVRYTEERLAALRVLRELLLGNARRRHIRAHLTTQFSHLGPWTAQRTADAICQLRRGVPGIEPLPELLPEEVEKQQILSLIETAVRAGEGWATIARRLNATSLRPSRGSQFTPIQVRLLYLQHLDHSRGGAEKS
jgi:hypothetical protein